MWDCTLTSPNLDDSRTVGVDESKLAVSISMAPRTAANMRPKGGPHWDSFGCACTPQELRDHPLREFTDESRRAFKVVAGKFACLVCNDGVLRTTRGHDAHYRVAHENLDIYGSFTDKQSGAGGRVNPNVPEGRDGHRAKMLKDLRSLGVTARSLATEGYTLGELDRAGFTFKDLHAIGTYTVEDLRAAGVTRQLKAAGLALSQLTEAGYTLSVLRKAGYSVKALKVNGASLGELRATGFNLSELRAVFSLSELKDLKRQNGTDKDPAFTIQDFMKEGYGCKDMRNAGFSLAALKSGYTEVR
jgi:intracellular multiplication protein IcmE